MDAAGRAGRAFTDNFNIHSLGSTGHLVVPCTTIGHPGSMIDGSHDMVSINGGRAASDLDHKLLQALIGPSKKCLLSILAIYEQFNQVKIGMEY
jgi:hypothetical protein